LSLVIDARLLEAAANECRAISASPKTCKRLAGLQRKKQSLVS
jgi:hypothetical protein